MADTFSSAEGRRLFGFIGAGGTASALLGPLLTLLLLHWLAPRELLLVAALFLDGALFCAGRIDRSPRRGEGKEAEEADEPLGGSAFGAFSALLRSPYLLGLAAWIAAQSLAATVLYLTQARLVAAAVHGAGRQTALFAGMDAVVNVLTLLTQLFLTGWLIKRIGTGLAAALLPLLYMSGFLLLAAHPSLGLVIGLQIAQRWTNFAFANPARQVFFTVLSREEKFKAKTLIDAVFYRAADAVSGWIFGLLGTLGLTLSAIALVMAPLTALWTLLSLGLGRAERRRGTKPADLEESST
jgi:AAA family ATP:ADP antiporter